MSYRDSVMREGDIRCHVTKKADIRFTDGALPHAMGVTNVQIMRSSQDPSLAPEGLGWTYAHAAMLGYWQGEYMVQYLAAPSSSVPGMAFNIRARLRFSRPLRYPRLPITARARKFLQAAKPPTASSITAWHFSKRPTAACWP